MSKVPNMPDKIDSKFRYVLVAAQRAEQLMRGARPHQEAIRKAEPGQKKPTRVAQTEVHGDMVAWDYGPEPGTVTEEAVEAADAGAVAATGEEEVH